MGNMAAETIQYRPKIEAVIIDDSLAILPTTVFMAGQFVLSLPAALGSLYSKLKEKGIPITSNLIQDSNIYIDMLRPPEIAESFKDRVDSEIEERIGEDKHIKYAFNSISNIIDELLTDPGFRYRIDIRLRDKGNRRGWERVDLVIKFPDDKYGEITRYWKAIGTKVTEFYDSLQSNPAFSEDQINQIRKFIYIVVRSEDW